MHVSKSSRYEAVLYHELAKPESDSAGAVASYGRARAVSRRRPADMHLQLLFRCGQMPSGDVPGAASSVTTPHLRTVSSALPRRPLSDARESLPRSLARRLSACNGNVWSHPGLDSGIRRAHHCGLDSRLSSCTPANEVAQPSSDQGARTTLLQETARHSRRRGAHRPPLASG